MAFHSLQNLVDARRPRRPRRTAGGGLRPRSQSALEILYLESSSQKSVGLPSPTILPLDTFGVEAGAGVFHTLCFVEAVEAFPLRYSVTNIVKFKFEFPFGTV